METKRVDMASAQGMVKAFKSKSKKAFSTFLKKFIDSSKDFSSRKTLVSQLFDLTLPRGAECRPGEYHRDDLLAELLSDAISHALDFMVAVL